MKAKPLLPGTHTHAMKCCIDKAYRCGMAKAESQKCLIENDKIYPNLVKLYDARDPAL